MDPVAQSTLAAAADLGVPVDAVSTLRKYWFAGERRGDVKHVERTAAGQRRDRAGRRRAAAVRRSSKSGGHTGSSCAPCRSASWTTTPWCGSAARGSSTCSWPRCRRSSGTSASWAASRPTSSWRRSPRPGASTAGTRRSPAGSTTATSTASGSSRTCSRRRSSPRRRSCAAGWGDDDWCVSVFEDNAGVVRFDDEFNVGFKVETHNHPSALEPYGGANTGLGGVIRDILGTGLGAKPICNTDVFCFAPPDTPADALPPGVLHPRARDARRRRGRARLRQPHGHPDGQRRRLLRPRATSATRSSTAAPSA